MPSLSVVVSGGFAAKLEARVRRLQAGALAEVANTANEIRDGAVDNIRGFVNQYQAEHPDVGRRSGDLASHTMARAEGDGSTWVVGTEGVPYAKFVEYGTGQRGGAGGTYNGLERGPLPEGYAHGVTPGMEARPYLFPAREAAAEGFESRVKALVKDGGE